MTKVMRLAGNRARAGAQGYLASVPKTLTTCHLPFSLCENAHSRASSTQGLGPWDGNHSPTLLGRAAAGAGEGKGLFLSVGWLLFWRRAMTMAYRRRCWL